MKHTHRVANAPGFALDAHKPSAVIQRQVVPLVGPRDEHPLAEPQQRSQRERLVGFALLVGVRYHHYALAEVAQW